MQTHETMPELADRSSLAGELKNRARDYSLRDGTTITLRLVEQRDGQVLHDMFVEMVDGRRYSLQQPDEVRPLDEDYQRKFVDRCRTHPLCNLLVVEAEGAPVGYIQAVSPYFHRTHHIARLSMYLRPEWRGRGIGSLLMTAMIEWARVNPDLEKLGLKVFSNNPHAIRLYERSGFAVDGREVRGVKFGDGEYADVISMFLFV